MRKQFTKQEKLKKTYRKLSKKYDLTWKELRNQPYRDVEPFQRGWIIYITLRDDILRRKDVDFLLELLDLGYHKTLLTREVNHIRSVRRGVYFYFNGNWGTNLIPKRKHITPKQYNEFPERIKKYFTQFERYGRIYYKINIPYYWIKLKVKPNIVTKVMDINPKLESEYDKLRNLLNHQYWWRFDKYKDRWYHWKITKERCFIKAETYKHIQQELSLDPYEDWDFLEP